MNTKEIKTEGSCQCCECTIGAGISCRNQPDDEQQSGNGSEVMNGYVWKEIIGMSRKCNIFFRHIKTQHRSQYQEKQIDKHKYNRKREHVFLRFSDVAATQVFLHHLLVEACHGNGNEGSAEKMFPEIIRSKKIIDNQ